MTDPFEVLMSRTYRHVVGWGTGNYFLETVEPAERAMLDFLVDNDKSKWGGKIGGVPVQPPGKLKELNPDETLVIVFSTFFDEIKPAIEALGHRNYLPGREWIQLHLKWTEEALRQSVGAATSSDDLAELYYRQAGFLRRAGMRWQVAEVLEKAIAADGRHADWHWELGEARESMNRFAEAADAFAQAIGLNADAPPDWHYRLGAAWEAAGRPEAAAAAYAKAVADHRSPVARETGIAFFHHRHGRPAHAARALGMRLQEGSSPEWFFRLGKAQERCFAWEEAAEAYRKAVAASPGRLFWWHRLGTVCERLERWEEAAEAHDRSLTGGNRRRPSWQYRLGVARARQGRYPEACEAFFLALPATRRRVDLPAELAGRSSKDLARLLERDARSAALWRALGLAHEQEGAWEQAAKAHAEAMARDHRQPPVGFYLLGRARARAGDFKGACRAFANLYPLGRPSLVPIRGSVDTTTLYTECAETLPIEETTVLYECFFGRSMSCNPYALFRHVLDRPECAGWRHVWVLDNESKIPPGLSAMRRVVFVKRESPLYLRYLATAKYLVNNVTFPPYFSRREGQFYLNTWHGTPLKTLGLDVRGGNVFDHKNVARNFLHVTHLCSPNAHTSDALIRPYHVAGTFAGKLAETGYPRIDRTLNLSPEERAALRKRLGLADGEKVVLYAPTWRGDQGESRFDVERLKRDLERLGRLPAQLLFRGHHFTEKLLASQNLGVTVVPGDIDTNDLLSVVDVLVTDYSSIFFDFMPTGRPILYYVYDREEYAASRGLYFEMEEMPGPKCETIETLEDELRRLLESGGCQTADELYRKAQARFCAHEDGHASRRVADWFFFGASAKEIRREGKTGASVLFYTVPFMPNGITTSVLNLLTSLSATDLRLSVGVDPSAVASEPERMEKFRERPDGVEVLARVGRMNQTPEEFWVTRRFHTRYVLDGEGQGRAYARVFEREFVRLFGDAQFDALVDFAGYSMVWASLFAFAPARQRRRVIYMHNTMDEEWRTKYPYLSVIFQLYNRFDSIVAVSPVVRQKQLETIGRQYRLPEEKFAFCGNAIDAAKVKARSEEPVDVPMRTVEERGKTHFLVVGRMSPEKGHDKMLRAFARVHAQHPRTALWCLGDGPLRASIEDRIREMDLGRSVHLLGLVPNPFPCLKASDCLVMPSDHEGQPLILLEAMTLGKPILATDIDGVNALLREHAYGRLVENSEDGLVQGMLAFIEKGMDLPAFDVDKYQRSALDDFRRKVLGRPGK